MPQQVLFHPVWCWVWSSIDHFFFWRTLKAEAQETHGFYCISTDLWFETTLWETQEQIMPSTIRTKVSMLPEIWGIVEVWCIELRNCKDQGLDGFGRWNDKDMMPLLLLLRILNTWRAVSEDYWLSSYLFETTRRPRDLKSPVATVIRSHLWSLPIPAILFEWFLGYSTAYRIPYIDCLVSLVVCGGAQKDPQNSLLPMSDRASWFEDGWPTIQARDSQSRIMTTTARIQNDQIYSIIH